MKTLSSWTHAYLDYIFSALLFLTPNFFDFTPAAVNYCYLFGALHLTLSLCTQYPLGAIPGASFKLHGRLEVIESIFLVLTPWLVGFANDLAARNTFMLSGFALFSLCSLTDFMDRETIIIERDIDDEDRPPFRRAG